MVGCRLFSLLSDSQSDRHKILRHTSTPVGCKVLTAAAATSPSFTVVGLYERVRYEGGWSGGERHGVGKFTFAEGDNAWEGVWDMGQHTYAPVPVQPKANPSEADTGSSAVAPASAKTGQPSAPGSAGSVKSTRAAGPSTPASS